MKENRVVKNASWIIACKIAQSILQFIIGMISARYLGKDNYGVINYAASIVAFALPFMKLGFDAILVHELVESPEKEGEIMGTSLLMNIFSSAVCMLGVFGFVSFANAGELEKIIVCVLYSISIFCAALEMIQYWFQYKLQSKYSSIVMLIAYVIVSVYKIFLLVTEKSVAWFAVSHAIEYGIIGFALIAIYIKNGGQRFSFSRSRAKKMLSKSKHYILASLMVVIIQNTDHVMLSFMDSDAATGIYSAAITSVVVVQFVYTAIVDSFRPLILSEKKEENIPAYEKSVSRLYSIIMYLAIAQCIVFFVFARLIVSVLYGEDYMEAVSVLRFLIFYYVFSAMGLVRNVWILAESKQNYLWIINLSGALLNVGLNAVLIPFMGANGAALASLVTQFFANFVIGFIIRPIRKNNELMLKGLNPKFLIREAKVIIKQIKKGK